MSDSGDSIRPVFATPVKKKRRRVSSSSEEGSLHASSSDEIRVVSSSVRKRRPILSDSDSSLLMRSKRKEARRVERAEERLKQRERERELEKQILSSLKKSRPAFPSPDEYFEDIEDDDSFIDADIGSLLSSSDESEVENTDSWLLAFCHEPTLRTRVFAALADDPLGHDQTNACDVTPAHDLAIQGRVPDDLLVEDSLGVTPLDLLILNENFSSIASLPKIDLSTKSIDSVRLAIRAIRSNAGSLAQWLRYLNGCKANFDRAITYALEIVDDEELITILLSFGALVYSDQFRHSAVHTAALFGRPRSLRLLLGTGGGRRELERGERSEMSSRPLHLAAIGETAEHSECVDIICQFQPGQGGLIDGSGWPPLLYALKGANTATVKRLLEFDLQSGVAPQLSRCMQLALDPSAAVPVRKLLRVLGTDVEFFRSLNKFIALNIRVLNGPLKFLLDGEGSPVDVANKARYFRQMVGEGATDPRVEFKVEREAVLGGVLAEVRGNFRLRALRCHVTWFVGGVREAGVGEGPQKEFEAVVDAELKEGAFMETENFLFPSKTVDYIAVGKLLGLWLFQGKQLRLSAHIYPGVFEYILDPEGYEKSLEDLEEVDEELYASLKWLKENDISQMEETIVVTTEKEKFKYIQDQVRAKTYNENFEEIRTGFFQVLRKNEVDFFSGKELSVMLGGGERNSVDLIEWRRRTTYTGELRSSDCLVAWFWDFVAKLSVGEQALLLQFATGRFVLSNNFIIAGSGRNEESLPQASTCINLISLPRYQSRAKLEEMLLIAIRYGAAGYSFA